MRIAIVHSFYASDQPSGENTVVELQVQALRDAGHEVHLVARRTDVTKRRRAHTVRAAVTVATGFGPSPLPAIRAFDPDVVHVHNLFPNFGDRWVTNLGVPVVATMHNFRPACAAGTLSRNGVACWACPEDTSLAALRHRCYRDSLPATLPLWWKSRRPVADQRLLRHAWRLIVLSERSHSMYRRLGVDPAQLVVIPNPAPVAIARHDPDQQRDGWLFVGRLSPEKGIQELISQWPADQPLTVMGSGPLEVRLRQHAGASVTVKGYCTPDQVRAAMLTHQALVLPSICAETAAPLVYTEALASGLPVLALTGNSAADDVGQHGTGVVIDAITEAELSRALSQISADDFREQIAKRLHHGYALASWVRNLEDVYAESC